MLRTLLSLVASIARCTFAFFRSRENQAIVELALRQQLTVYVHRHPRLSPLDRAFWVFLSRFWRHWRSALVLVRPETVIRWHRKAFRGYWRWISKPGPGRPPIPEDTKALIDRMATENGWRARKIQAELSKLGIHLGLTTISRYLPKVDAGVDPHQRWMTFLRNHRDVIAGMDLWQGLFGMYGEHAALIAITVGISLVGVVTWGTLSGSMLPFALRWFRLDPASASAPFVATLVDVSGLVIYFSVAQVVLSGTLL